MTRGNTVQQMRAHNGRLLSYESPWKAPTLAYEHMRSMRASEAEASFCGAVVYMNRFLYFITAWRFCSIHASGICTTRHSVLSLLSTLSIPADWHISVKQRIASSSYMAHALVTLRYGLQRVQGQHMSLSPPCVHLKLDQSAVNQ